MMADNHYDPLPLHDFQVGEAVAFINAMSGVSSGKIVKTQRLIITIQIDGVENPVVGGPMIANVPHVFVWRLPQA